MQGLTNEEAEKRLKKYGTNTLPETPPPTDLEILLSQLKNPLVYILLFAALISLVLREFSDLLIIMLAVVINSTLGFVQERRASHALQALRQIVRPETIVVRDGEKVKIKVEDIVPGDIVVLEQGAKVPADGKLIGANRLFLEEAVLTGESLPVEKGLGDSVFMGTIVSSGEAIIEVTETGSHTEMGKIAQDVQKPDEDTPLTKQLKSFSSQLTKLVVALTVFVFFIGLTTGMDRREIFTTSVALAVSSIPEGLLIALTVILAIGMQKILKRKGLVKNLVSAETLGGVTTICVDKTGTLTYGKLKVVEEHGDVQNVCLQHFATSEDPIMVAARNWLKDNSTHFEELEHEFKQDCKIIDHIPFTPQNRFYASLINHKDGKREIYVNGAPEHLLEWSSLKNDEHEEIKKLISKATRKGLRVIGMAKKEANDIGKFNEEHVKGDLTWVGLLVFTDPVRKNIGETFAKIKTAGIKTILITGDYADTARNVMKELQMEVPKDRVFLGQELEKMADSEVAQKLAKLFETDKSPILFARTKPQQKLKVINALKINREIVAMMGDGVNDAPALKKADIGIVVAESTDVAKETSDLVLLDSDFETVVEAIEEGRGIFDNLRKVILYLLSDAFEEIVAVIASLIMAIPLPVTAAQILWINILSDGFPNLALSFDPKDPRNMTRPPRNSSEPVVNMWMKTLIGIVSFSGGLLAVGLFGYFYKETGDLSLARSVAFASLGVNSLLYVFSIRALLEPVWRVNPFTNKWLVLSVGVGFILQFFPFFFAPARDFFKLAPLNLTHLSVIFASSIMVIMVIETLKLFVRAKHS